MTYAYSSLSKPGDCIQGRPDHWARTFHIQNYAHSIKSLNNFQNALSKDFDLLHIKVLIFGILSKVSINKKKRLPSFTKKKAPSLYKSGAALSIAYPTQVLLHVSFLFVCFVALRPKSTVMVMAGRSIHLITLFSGQA